MAMFNFLGMSFGGNVRIRKRSAQQRKVARTREGRLSGYFPRESPGESGSALAAELNSRMLFFSLASQSCTGLIEIASETQRVRAALLMIDGRFVGAFFGRHSMERKLYGREAYHEILSQLAHLETRVSVQPLSNQLALATLPLFEEEVFAENTICGIDPNSLIHEIRERNGFGLGFVDDINGNVAEIFYFAEGRIFCRFYPVSGEATFLGLKNKREPKFGFRNSNLRVYLSTFDVGSPDGLYSVRDIEGDPLAISLDAKDEKAMAAVLRRNFHPGGLVSVLSKNRMSHCEEQTRAIRRGEQKAIRPARSQHHSHFVNPFRDEG
jgi:hypothetical protein